MLKTSFCAPQETAFLVASERASQLGSVEGRMKRHIPVSRGNYREDDNEDEGVESIYSIHYTLTRLLVYNSIYTVYIH